MEKIEKLIKKYKKREDLIKLLQEVQNLYGYLPIHILKKIGKEKKIFPSEIFSIATFYTHFKFLPQAKHIIKVCHGTACHISGIERINARLDELLKKKPKSLFLLEKVACLGCCSLAPCIMINKKVYGRLNENEVEKILNSYK